MQHWHRADRTTCGRLSAASCSQVEGFKRGGALVPACQLHPRVDRVAHVALGVQDAVRVAAYDRMCRAQLGHRMPDLRIASVF